MGAFLVLIVTSNEVVHVKPAHASMNVYLLLYYYFLIFIIIIIKIVCLDRVAHDECLVNGDAPQ